MSLPIKELINIGTKQLRDAGVADAEIDAKELYCFMQHMDRTALMLRWQEVLQDNQCEAYFDLIERRASRVPLQHITGSQEFMGLPFEVNEKVLIECKAIGHLGSEQRQQLWNYMRLSGIRVGILYNFAPIKDECEKYYYDPEQQAIFMF